MVEKLKQLADAYKDEFAQMQKRAAATEPGPLRLVIEAKMDVVRLHAIQLQGIVEGECAEYVELVKSFG